ncbi:hypothetical protein JOB18_045914 [Solea senegalensis]|uniref:Uncharacterized protein n=1 Tax=Solea senegalensis TaxID=28829 RepID=A0AAV6SCE2_SOLSE|nr:hypothetical protein JOB18_045914 [Solea senegalensis]
MCDLLDLLLFHYVITQKCDTRRKKCVCNLIFPTLKSNSTSVTGYVTHRDPLKSPRTPRAVSKLDTKFTKSLCRPREKGVAAPAVDHRKVVVLS